MKVKIFNTNFEDIPKIITDKEVISICVFGEEKDKYFNFLKDIYMKCKDHNFFLVISTFNKEIKKIENIFSNDRDLCIAAFDEKIFKKYPKLLRYLPPLFLEARAFHFRDSDSYLIDKDINLIENHDFESFPFLIIRDHLLHYYPIMGGMFSTSNSVAKMIANKILNLNNRFNYKNINTYDQDFLSKEIYTNFKGQIQVYSSSAVFFGEKAIKLNKTEDYIGRPAYLKKDVRIPYLFKIIRRKERYFLPKFLIKNPNFLRARLVALIAITYELFRFKKF